MDLRTLKIFRDALDKESNIQNKDIADQFIAIINQFDASKDSSFYKPFFGSLQGPVRDLYLTIRYSRESNDQYFSIELHRAGTDQILMYKFVRFLPRQYERVYQAIKEKAVALDIRGAGFAKLH